MGRQPATVLIGFAESFAAIEAAWSLRQAGYRVVAFARPGRRPPLSHDRSVEVIQIPPPESDVRACLTAIDDLITRLRPDALLPLDDGSLWLTMRINRSECRVVGPPVDAAEVALDKASQVRLAQSAGLSVPTTRVALLSEIEYTGESMIIKASQAVREVDNRLTRPAGRFCGSAQEVEAAKNELPDITMLAQPVLRGNGVGVFGSIGDHHDSPWSAHMRVRMVNPSGSASSACRAYPVDPDLQHRVDAMLDGLGWRGLFMAEFLQDDVGTNWFMELNGRAWGSLALARRRGYEYPAWAVQDTLGHRQVPASPVDPPQIQARHLGREIVHLAFVLRGPTSSGVASWPSRTTAIRDVLKVQRNDRWYNWDRRRPLVFLADTWRTLADQMRRLTRGRQ